MKTFIIIIISAIVFSSTGYFIAKRFNKPLQVIPPKELLKKSEESTTTPAGDTNSLYLKEEMARKKQRDLDREKCINDANREYTEFNAKYCPGFWCLKTMPKVKENIDRCYFRFPNN